jgi:perosamine synthetase
LSGCDSLQKGIGPVSTSFEPGAPAPEGSIPLCVPEIRGNEWKYIKECLDTGWVSSVGPFVDRFERELAAYVGRKHAVATVNGTAALHIALLVAGVQPDDEVLVSTLTFIAPANAIRYVGAWPVFIDAEPDYWQMDPEKTVDFLEKECQWRNGALYNKTTCRRVKAILPVHILGHPVDMDPILEVARKYNLVVVEDATESLGAKYKGRMVGHLGDITCFSFNGNKIITTGGGGMIVTDNEAWAHKAKYLTTQAKDDPVEYIHNEIGYNYRLTNVQAAMGVAQLEILDEYIAAKRAIAYRYAEKLADVPGLTFPKEADWASSISWMYTLLIDETVYGLGSRDLMHQLQQAQIQSRPLWHPIYSLKPFADCYAHQVRVADRLYRDGLSLPCSVGLKSNEQLRVIDLLCRLSRGERD